MKVIKFTTNNARILEIPEADVMAFQQLHPGCLVNPSMDRVAGFPPHHWNVVDGRLEPMNGFEQAQRDAEIAKNGVDNDIGERIVAVKLPVQKKRINMQPWFLFALGVGASLIVELFRLWMERS